MTPATTTTSQKSSLPTDSAPIRSSDAKAALRGLFATFPTKDRSDPAAVLGTYLIALEGYSQKAVQGAITRIIRGEAGLNTAFLPTPAELSTVVRYMEGLYAPPKAVLALPAPGDVRDDSPEGIAHRASVVDRLWRKPKASIPTPEMRQAGHEAPPAADPF